jgi:hypothetical protein
VDTTQADIPIDLAVLDLAHEVIIVDDKDESSNKVDNDDKDGVEEKEASK